MSRFYKDLPLVLFNKRETGRNRLCCVSLTGDSPQRRIIGVNNSANWTMKILTKIQRTEDQEREEYSPKISIRVKCAAAFIRFVVRVKARECPCGCRYWKELCSLGIVEILACTAYMWKAEIKREKKRDKDLDFVIYLEYVAEYFIDDSVSILNR